MNIIDKENYLIVKREIESLYCILVEINKMKNCGIISLGLSNYIVLILIEIINYISVVSNTKITYNNKSKLNKIRAKLKPTDQNFEQILNSMSNTNYNSYNRYTKDFSNFKQLILNPLITNLGIFYYNDKIISNTFLIENDSKAVFFSNEKPDSKSSFNFGFQIGNLIQEIAKIFNCDLTKNSNNQINDVFYSKDFNVYNNNNNLLNPNIDINISLFLLNILTYLNFYTYIIRNLDIVNSLKYRLAYIIFYRSYYDLKKILANHNISELYEICNNYSFLDNRTFRNGIFHYNLKDKLDTTDYISNEMYIGLINKYLKISEEEFKNSIDNFIFNLSNIIEKIILL